MQKVSARGIGIALAAVIAAAMSLSVYWAFRVPIFEAPDENDHLDYTLNIYSAGRPITARETLRDWNAPPGEYHVWTQYLADQSGANTIVFHYGVKAPPGYGTREYYRRLDLNTPAEDSGGLAGKPRTKFSKLTEYPAFYYGFLAAWIRLLRVFSHRITVLFFGARLLSVLLLACSLILTYCTARQLRFTPARAVLLTGIVGLFPMTTFVSSYIQADNLSLTLVMLCCYLALRLRREPDDARLLVLLGLSLGFLSVTKYHFFAATSLAIFPMVIADTLAGRRKRIGWLTLLVALAGPTLVLMCVQLWIWYGGAVFPVLSHDRNTTHAGLSAATHYGKWAVVSYLGDGLGYAFSNFYLNGASILTGNTFNSFWGNFGWTDTPLIIASQWKTHAIRDFIALLDVVVFGLAVMRLQQVLGRLVAIGKRGRWKQALWVASSNPLMNAYFIFTIMMLGLFMVVRTSFAPQGRNWFPFIAAIFMVGPDYASKALSHKFSQRALRLVIVGGLVLYCIVGSYYAIQSINRRYYSPAEAAPAPVALGQPSPDLGPR